MKFGKELAENGVQVVSGMALGIDGAGHEGALTAGGKTFGILGCGVNICYPERAFFPISNHVYSRSWRDFV